MANNEEYFDDEQAVPYILENIFPDFRGKVTEEQVEYILDCEDDYYTSKGYYDEDADDEVEIDDDEAFDFICNKVQEDGRAGELSPELIGAILDANYAYCEEAGIFDDDDEDDDEMECEDEDDCEEDGYDDFDEDDITDAIAEQVPEELRNELTPDNIARIVSTTNIFWDSLNDHLDEMEEDISEEEEDCAVYQLLAQEGDALSMEAVCFVTDLMRQIYDDYIEDDDDEE